jgi:hypothetical protein
VVAEIEGEMMAEEKALVKEEPAKAVVFDADDPVALYMDGGVFAQLQRVATLMSSSGLVPDHLKGAGKVADCFLVAAQAFRWRMDPFAVAQHTFVLKGKLGYEGKLIAAVVNSHRRIDARLAYTYSGEGASRSVSVSARIKGEDKDRTVEGSVGRWATDNEQWKKDPDQMLAYRGARQWARRHMPEAMIGIQAEEEIAAVAIEAKEPPRTLEALTERLMAPEAPAREPGSDDGPPAECKHEDCPPSKVAALAPGKSLVCRCGAEFRAEPKSRLE